MIPDWLALKMANPPASGAGVHGWLFSVARQLHAHLSPEQITARLTAAVQGCGRRVTEREIRDAVGNSVAAAWTKTPEKRGAVRGGNASSPAGGVRAHPASSPDSAAWPVHAPALRDGAVALGRSLGVWGLAELWELSPVRLEESAAGEGEWCEGSSPKIDAGEWLDWLFPGAEWLCLAGDHPGSAATRRRDKWAFRESEFAYVVPSPMTAASGRGLDGNLTRRCLDNTGLRRWLVVEFDSGSADDQAALHWCIDHQAAGAGWPRLALCVHSGGKSLHGWYGPVTDEEAARDLMAWAILHCGADSRMWPKCQLARMPEGTRGGQRRQTVFYWRGSAATTTPTITTR